MKSKKISKKLSLGKETIARLDNESLQEIKINMKNIAIRGGRPSCTSEICEIDVAPPSSCDTTG